MASRYSATDIQHLVDEAVNASLTLHNVLPTAQMGPPHQSQPCTYPAAPHVYQAAQHPYSAEPHRVPDGQPAQGLPAAPTTDFDKNTAEAVVSNML